MPTMTPPRILLVEDSADDAELLLLELENGGLSVDYRRCENARQLAEALAGGGWQLVLSDYHLPTMTAPEVIRQVHQVDPDMPVVVVSGHIGEEEAVGLMKAGAADFVSKSNLTRLAPAVEREIRDAATRRSERVAVAALRESRERLSELTAFLQSVREEERKALARELHDELGQSLTGLRMDADWLAQSCRGADAAVHAKITAMTRLIDDTLKLVRRMSADLRPAVLDDLGLEAGLEWLLSGFQQRSGVDCSARLALGDGGLPEPAATTVFRLVQESLTNVGRHARARSVRVEAELADGWLSASVSDDGAGFDPAGRRGGSFGLIGMEERLRALGGELHIASRPGAGTRVSFRLPVAAADPSAAASPA